jgi:hypothetical protein
MLRTTGSATIDAQGVVTISAPAQGVVTIEAPSGAAGTISSWGKEMTLELQPKRHVLGRIMDGPAAATGMFEVTAFQPAVRQRDEDEVYRTILTNDRFDWTIDPRVTKLEIRSRSLHLPGFETGSEEEDDGTDAPLCWPLSSDAGTEIECVIDRRSPPGPCSAGRVRVVGHIAGTSGPGREMQLARYGRDDHGPDVHFHVRADGWFDCGDVKPGEYELKIHATDPAARKQWQTCDTVKIAADKPVQILELTAPK